MITELSLTANIEGNLCCIRIPSEIEQLLLGLIAEASPCQKIQALRLPPDVTQVLLRELYDQTKSNPTNPQANLL
jgi:hypothetical protein